MCVGVFVCACVNVCEHQALPFDQYNSSNLAVWSRVFVLVETHFPCLESFLIRFKSNYIGDLGQGAEASHYDSLDIAKKQRISSILLQRLPRFCKSLKDVQ